MSPARSRPDAAADAAMRIGYPVVLKIVSPQIVHKTEVGGVAVGLADEAALRSARMAMDARVRAARPDATIDGYLVEAMAAQGLELIVGGRRDPDWGPVVLVGLGGVWIEALHVAAIGRLLLAHSEIVEIDVKPLVVGEGVPLALDALVILD